MADASPPAATPSTDKSALRRELRARRAALDPEARTLASHRTVAVLTGTSLWQKATVVALYRATEQEMNLGGLAGIARGQGKHLVYPRTLADGVMHFHDPGEPAAFEPGPGGIEQPAADCDRVPATEIDLILVPLLGCDDRGVRLGYGGGYYDRFLPLTNAIRVGVGFACQRVAQLPAEAHDARLSWFVDEDGLQGFG